MTSCHLTSEPVPQCLPAATLERERPHRGGGQQLRRAHEEGGNLFHTTAFESPGPASTAFSMPVGIFF